MTSEKAETLTIRECAAFLRCSPLTAWRYVKSGRLSGYKLPSGRWLIRHGDLERFLTGGRTE